jgi:hypothetical protein
MLMYGEADKYTWLDGRQCGSDRGLYPLKAYEYRPSQNQATLPRSASSNRSTVKGVSARPSSFLSILVRPHAGYRVVYAVDAMIAAG